MYVPYRSAPPTTCTAQLSFQRLGLGEEGGGGGVSMMEIARQLCVCVCVCFRLGVGVNFHSFMEKASTRSSPYR